MNYTLEFIELPISIHADMENECEVSEVHEVSVKLLPKEIESYRPHIKQSKDGNTELTMLFMKSKDYYLINLSMAQFEEKLDEFMFKVIRRPQWY